MSSTPAVVPAAPAAATEEKEVSMQERLNAATPEEYKTWEQGGEFPPIKPKSETAPPKTETPAASTESSATELDETTPPTKVETEPATEPGKPQKKRSGDARILQLLDERKKDRETFEARLKEIESRIVKPAEPSAKSESSSAADGKTEVKASDEPKLDEPNPKTGKPYQTIAEWQKDHTAWLEAKILAQVEGRFTKSEAQRTQAEQERVLNEGMNAKLEVGRTKYPDFKTVAENPDLYIPRGSATDTFLRTSENAAEVLYYLGQHSEVLEGFYREPSGQDRKKGAYENTIHPQLQFLELAKIEARLMAAPVTTVTPKPSAQVPKPLPPPPTVLSAKGSAAGDAVEEALSKKSFADYEKAANASERKARRA